jgi:amidase
MSRSTDSRAPAGALFMTALCLAGSLCDAASAGPAPPGEAATAQLERSIACIAASDADFNAVLALDISGAAQAARSLDGESTPRPLAGMPVLVKDNIETRDLPTTAGSLALVGNDTGRDAPLVAQLREAGALILGKTNLSEWANFRSEHSSSGWSGVGGQTRNAVNPARTPCGSSSGSAVAVARGYVPMAVGTETSGSIVCPAAINGVVGFKPTHGRVSGDGIVPLAATQDTAGPIADSVATAAISLAYMLDPQVAGNQDLRAGLLRYDARPGLAGLRIGVLENSRGFDARRDRELAAVLATLRGAGATVIEGLRVDHYEGFNDDAYAVLLYEFRRGIGAYLASVPAALAVRDLGDLVAFNIAHAARELAVFDQSIFLHALALEDDADAYAKRLAAIRTATRDKGLDALFDAADLDAIIGVTSSVAWLIDPVNGDAFFGPGMANDAAIAGNPHITLPLAAVAGLPLGISLVGERGADHHLARIAYRLEQAHPRPDYAWSIDTPAERSAACSGASAAP